MGCQSEVLIGDNLTFSITTHDPETGILTDADSVPIYRVYEDSTEAAILNGDMDSGTGPGSQFDNANTTGFYVKSIACTAANGFEDGKSYTIYVEATVDSFLGGIALSFKAKEKLIEGALTYDEMFRIIMSALAGKSTGGGTATVKFRDLADGKDRIEATVDADGNRTGIILDGAP